MGSKQFRWFVVGSLVFAAFTTIYLINVHKYSFTQFTLMAFVSQANPFLFMCSRSNCQYGHKNHTNRWLVFVVVVVFNILSDSE